MSNRVVTENWISLMEYSMKKGVSLSTLRRYIKANKIPYRTENGRYLLLDEDYSANNTRKAPSGATASDGSAAQLNQQLQKAREEIAELKTLIAFYEESLHSRLDV